MSKTIYAGIDVSKAKLDLAMLFPNGSCRDMGEFENIKDGIHSMIAKASKQAKKVRAKHIHFAVESTGKYSNAVVSALRNENGSTVSCVNPAQVNYFGKMTMVRTKTDKVDAKLIATFCSVTKPQPIPETTPEFKKLRELSRHRCYLVQQCAHQKTYLESVEDVTLRQSILSIIDQFKAMIKEVDGLISQHLKSHGSLAHNVDLLCSIPGIAKQTAVTILTELHPERGNGKYTKSVQSAHSGLAPSKRESGAFKGVERISKTGNALLRKSLYMPAMNAMRNNPFVKELYDRLLAKGKKPKVALIGSMRKLLMFSIGVLNNQTPFDPHWVSIHPNA